MNTNNSETKQLNDKKLCKNVNGVYLNLVITSNIQKVIFFRFYVKTKKNNGW